MIQLISIFFVIRCTVHYMVYYMGNTFSIYNNPLF